ncbi:DsrE family protein [Tautonia marina]|uniref:DsrE family protein n=1 Tax=Tautonia marina TaxID=2653855 RepID=UPI001260D19B|nr:DsrE family protein [Tautonia marina]
MTSRIAWAALALIGVGVVLSQTGSRADDRETSESLRVLVHMNFADTGRQGQGMKNISRILEADPTARVVVVCHSGGINVVEAVRTDHAEAIASLIDRGVTFVACENTMKRNGITKDDLISGVGTVPSGAVEVVRRQQFDGFAYFRP